MRRGVLLSLLFALVLSAPAMAQDWSPEQTEVWNVIVAQWDSDKASDHTWTERSLHQSFLGWSDENPMPSDRDSVKRWENYSSENLKVLEQELYPVGIVVEGTTAVAHYFYSVAAEDREGKRKTTHGRYTDVLVKTDGVWLFIAWRGGDDPRFNIDDS